MATHEETLYALLKQSESLETNEADSTAVGNNNVYEDQGEIAEGAAEDSLSFSTGAKDSNKDVRYELLGRVLSNKEQAARTERALMGANLKTVYSGNFESSAPLLAEVKTSSARGMTLSERVRRVTNS